MMMVHPNINQVGCMFILDSLAPEIPITLHLSSATCPLSRSG
jgi:hypothetical protein